jgi:hypothetical protein
MIFWGWGRRSITKQLDQSNAVIRTYRYAHIFFFFTLTWGGAYSLATLTEAGWAQRPISKEDAKQLLGGKDLQPNLWKRFSLVLGAAVVAVIAISASVAHSSTNLAGHTGSQSAWASYFGDTNATIAQLNDLGKKPLSASVLSSTEALLVTLENSPDATLNAAVANAITVCQTNKSGCNAAIDSAGRAYNSALDEAAREGLIHIAQSSTP